jgi:hypothetical protein
VNLPGKHEALDSPQKKHLVLYLAHDMSLVFSVVFPERLGLPLFLLPLNLQTSLKYQNGRSFSDYLV